MDLVKNAIFSPRSGVDVIISFRLGAMNNFGTCTKCAKRRIDSGMDEVIQSVPWGCLQRPEFFSQQVYIYASSFVANCAHDIYSFS